MLLLTESRLEACSSFSQVVSSSATPVDLGKTQKMRARGLKTGEQSSEISDLFFCAVSAVILEEGYSAGRNAIKYGVSCLTT